VTTYPAGLASWYSPLDWEMARRLLRATAEWSHIIEYPRMVDERAGAAGVIAGEEFDIKASSMTPTS